MRVCGQPKTPSQKARGRHKKINTPELRQLVDIATRDSVCQRLTFTEVAEIADIQACERVLRDAFESEGKYLLRLCVY